MIYSDKYPRQDGGDMGCMCRTCGLVPAVYLDQCETCRSKTTREHDRQYLKPGGEWERRRNADRAEAALN